MTHKLHIKEVSFGTVLTYWGVYRGDVLVHYTFSKGDALKKIEELKNERNNSDSQR
jgi:hypothetical protein